MDADSTRDDTPPDDQTEQAAYRGYRGRYGAIKTNIVATYAGVGALLGGPDSADGLLFLSAAEPIADAWLAWGKTDKRYMRIVQVLWGHAAMTLVIAHVPLAAGLAANHQLRLPLARLVTPLGGLSRLRGHGASAASESGAETGPLYQSVGAYAPTSDAGPPPMDANNGNLRVFPDEGIPAELDVALRQAARQSGRPYQELRNEALLQLAQLRIAEQSRVHQAGALGHPVARE